MNDRLLFGGLAGMLAVAAGSSALAYPTVYPTGTTIYYPDQAWSSYILISDHTDRGNHPSAAVRAQAKVPDDVRLIDMNGNVVHVFRVAPYFNKRSRLLANGNLLYAGDEKRIVEYDWDSNIVWQHEGIESVNDLRILDNGNRLLIAHEPIPAEAQAKVRDVGDKIAPWWKPRKRGSEEHQNGADIYEVNLDGEIVWEWHAHDHLDLNLFSPVTPLNDWLHVNSIAPIPENKWFDAGDERFRPGNIILNARNINMIYIIDKRSGDVVWEGTHDYKGGMAHSHEPEMIEKGLPGAGNIIFFDNSLFPRHRTHTGQTFVMEMNPVSGEIVWIYETEGYANIKFFSKTMGSQKRLPNGNTFIAEDNTGRLFQVKPDGSIVWEYVNRGGTTRPSVVPYDFTPQLRALPRPEEKRVTPPNNLQWRLLPDADRQP
ncbi:MAG: arylsulfotransferase family protein [Woeseiaceae bacterium]|nr:arylsulfotransferase family protein [Woeseiaceae bacterium]